MTASTIGDFEIRVVHIPQVLVPLAIAAAVALVGLAALFGIALLLIMSPLIFFAVLVRYLRRLANPEAAPAHQWNTWSDRRSRTGQPIVIDGDCIVLDEEPCGNGGASKQNWAGANGYGS